MTLNELKNRLEEERIFKGLYSFFSDGDGDCLVLSKEGSDWLVYCTERGEHYAIKKFTAEDEACQYFLSEVLSMPSARYKIFTAEDFELSLIWAGNDQKGYRPISRIEMAEHDDTLIINSIFTTNGHTFNGYLIGRDFFFACGLFVKDRVIKINTSPHFNAYNQENIEELFSLLDCDKFVFFPLHYESKVRLKNGLISGTLDVRPAVEK